MVSLLLGKDFLLDYSFSIFPSPLNEEEPKLEGEHSYGDENSSDLTGSDEFYEHRDFQLGDNWKRVNWKALAKTDKKLTKIFITNRSEAYDFNVNQVGHLETEVGLSLLTAWLLHAEKTQSSYKLTVGNIHFDYGQGHGHLLKCLTALTDYKSKEVVL